MMNEEDRKIIEEIKNKLEKKSTKATVGDFNTIAEIYEKLTGLKVDPLPKQKQGFCPGKVGKITLNLINEINVSTNSKHDSFNGFHFLLLILILFLLLN